MRKSSINPVDVYVGSRIRQARLQAGLSQEKLSVPLGLTFQQVQKYEHGTNRVAPSRLLVIASIVGKPVSWFYEGAPVEGTTVPAVADPIQQLGMTRDGVALARAFTALHDQRLRASIVSMIEQMAAISDREFAQQQAA